MNKMPIINIALIIDSLDRGGAERLLVSLANNLDYEKYQVFVITTHHQGEFFTELNSNVHYFCLTSKCSLRICRLIRFVNIIKKNNIKIVHSHSHTAAYFVETIKEVFHLHYFHIMHDHYGLISENKVIQCLDSFFLKKINYYFGVSEQLYHYAISEIGIPKNKCEYLPNGINVPRLITQNKEKIFTIVQVGTISPNKNQIMSVKIAAQLQEMLPNFQWLLIGRLGDNRKYIDILKKEITYYNLQNKVFLLGDKSNIGFYLEKAHVGVLTSKFEALPMALIEYMAWGLPVIVTDVGDCRKIVEKSGGGKVLSFSDENNFSKYLFKLSINPDLSRTLGENNYSTIVSNYGINKMINSIESVYDNLLLC